ncbi:MAG TPA: polymer-forming cytoskeletal protein [Steroidobacteraceae bacterium]|nr:polymer-forming cytoskeletal protein [Steroidobacteraceae bacterium]
MSDENDDRPPATKTRRFLDRSPTATTVIGAGSQIVGNLRGNGSFIIAGEIRGDGDLEGHLNLTVSGAWHGQIRARAAIVCGKIVGGLRVDEKLEIGRTAEIRGSVSAGSVSIANGAIIDGDIGVTSDGGIVEFEERRRD